MNPMQGQRSTIDSSIEVINIDDEPNSSMSSQTSLNNVLHQVDGRFSNYTVSSDCPTYLNSSAHNVQSFNGRSSGEPSSRLGFQDQVNDTGSKTENLFPSDNFRSHSGYRSEERLLDSTRDLFPGRLRIGHDDNQVRDGPFFVRGSSSNHIPRTMNLDSDMGNSSNNSQHSGFSILPNSGGSSFGSSSQAGEENCGASGSSLGGWGSSCKRKALEGTSGQSFPGGSPGGFSQAENIVWHTGSSQHDTSSSLNLSAPAKASPVIGSGLVATNSFPSTRNAESSGRPSGRRLNPGEQHEAVPFSLSSSAENFLRSSVSSRHQLPVSAPLVNPLGVRSTPTVNANSSASETQPNLIHLPALTRNIHHFAWNAASSSRTDNSSSARDPGERFVAPWEDINAISIPRSNSEHLMFAPATGTRHPVQDQSVWGLTRGNPSSSGDVPFAPRAGPNSAIHSLQPTPAWIPPQSSSMHNPQRISELAPWSFFPSIESESASHGGSFPLLPTGPAISSSEAVGIPSGSSSRSHRLRPRRSGLILERHGDDLHHMRHLGRSIAADSDGRHRLLSEIRQVLNAMRRGDDLRVEDYMVFDPVVYHGMAEIHDRHRDMRLDVDNMSYEELLALGERIGDVNTGLSEETILSVMKQHKFIYIATEPQQYVEPCCICQEEYTEGDDLGTLDCGHDFHTHCIKQWIMLKNLCPICKTKGLSP